MNLLEMEPGLATTMSGEAMDPMGRRDTEPAIVLDLMGEGFAIERHPTPAATIVASGVAAEALLQRLSESAETIGKDGGLDEEPFASKPVTGDPAEIFGGIKVIGGDAEGAQTFIRQLIGAVERPADGKEHAAAADIEDGHIEEEPRVDDLGGWGKTAMLALRRSKAGKATVTAMAATTGLFIFGASSASAQTLKNECLDAGLAPPDSISAVMQHPGTKRQTILVRGYYEPMPAECVDAYKRTVKGNFQIQPAEHLKQWRTIAFPRWFPLTFGGNNEGGNIASSIGLTGHEDPWVYVRSRKQHARVLVQNELVDIHTGKVIGEEIEKKVSVKIQR